MLVDDADVARSTVQVNVNTSSIQMMDAQQSEMLKDADFFDVAKFPKMTYVSSTITRTSDSTLKVEGDDHPARHHPADGARRSR